MYEFWSLCRRLQAVKSRNMYYAARALPEIQSIAISTPSAQADLSKSTDLKHHGNFVINTTPSIVQQIGGLANMVDIAEHLLGKSVVTVTDKGLRKLGSLSQPEADALSIYKAAY